MKTLETLPFGKTGHKSTRTIFGSAGLRQATQDEADQILDLLMEYGINHIDTAPAYGDAELRIGPWMKHYRDRFFLATKTNERSYQDAKEQFHRSLERLNADRVDLLQLHNMTDVVTREYIMGQGGALEFLIEAKEQGLARFIGVTGHGIEAPKMHRQSLSRFNFDTVLLPCNYLLLQNEYYASHFHSLLSYCKEKNIAFQTIKSIARGLWGDKRRSHATWYDPVTDDESISRMVRWVLSNPGIFLITVGDMQLLPKVLAAAADHGAPLKDEEIADVVQQEEMVPLFD